MKAGLWQRTDGAVRLTFNQPPRGHHRPLVPPADDATRALWRRERFALYDDGRTLGEVMLRALKEGA